MRVVYLTNFLSPDIVDICREMSVRIDELIVLVSVPMEGNRSWKPTDAGLDVRVQKTYTRTRTDRHPSGYEDVNYVHVPLDTLGQLRRIRPDAIISTEMGARSIQAAAYRRFHAKCRQVIAVNTSQHIEASRNGSLRRWQRCRLLRLADAVTHNGPSSRDYLLDLGVHPEKLSEWMYAADPTKIYRGPILDAATRVGEPERCRDDIRLLTVGQLIDRKGVQEALDALVETARANPTQQLRWTVVGGGPLQNRMQQTDKPTNLNVVFRGNCEAAEIRDAYRDHDVMLFPTLGDEWGLVVDEALHSGLAVIGSRLAQSVPTLIREGFNGWSYCPTAQGELPDRIRRWLAMASDERLRLRKNARESAKNRTPSAAADQICDVLTSL